MAVATDVLFLPARELAALIRAKKLSPVELTDAYLARIEQLNPRTNAAIKIRAAKVPKFRAGKALKDAVN